MKAKATVWRWCYKCMDWHLVAHFDYKREAVAFIRQPVDWRGTMTTTHGEKPDVYGDCTCRWCVAGKDGDQPDPDNKSGQQGSSTSEEEPYDPDRDPGHPDHSQMGKVV